MSLALTLLAACVASSPTSDQPPASAPDFAVAYLKGIGDAAMRTYGTEAIKKYAPEAMAILDTSPADGVVTMDEFVAVVGTNITPEKASWLTLVALAVFEAHRKERR